jgi:hypothetical protein
MIDRGLWPCGPDRPGSSFELGLEKKITLSTLLFVHQMPAASDPLGADEPGVSRGRASHRLADGLATPDREIWGASFRDVAARDTTSPDQPTGGGPYPPRQDPWTVGSGSSPIPTEGWATGSIPVIAADRPQWLRPVQAGGITVAWLFMIMLAGMLGRADGIRSVALFAHLIFLAVGFGAVLAIGLNGLALMLRWVRVSRVVTVAVALDPLIWLGLAGLCLSGIVLNPDLDRGWTWLKLLAVLAVAVNGLWHRDLMAELGQLPGKAGRRSISPELLRRAIRVSATSQLGWWVAVAVGFVATNG